MSEPVTEAHPEARCQRCHNRNPVWFTDDALWNEVMGSPNGIVCPPCFVVLAEAKGVGTTGAWRLSLPACGACGSFKVARDQSGLYCADCRFRRRSWEEAADAEFPPAEHRWWRAKPAADHLEGDTDD